MIDIKERREEKNMTQSDLAKHVGISRQAISNIENGIAKPDVRHAKLIGQALEFDWWDLFNDKNPN